MCIDYTSLNKACPKDPFALPRIDQVIDSTAGCELLSFLDAYSGYHQIKLDPADALKMSFITPFEAYCYITMSFGLKNVGATFQRCMQKCLLPQLGKNIHVYMDDIVVKTKQHLTLLDDLKETFANLREYKVKLNPKKCIFGVPAGKLLGFLVSERGIEANPEKIKAIKRMRKPTQLRDVQKFSGCLASVSRFLSRLGEKALPLYQLMKKTSPFEWNGKAEEAFQDLKRMLSIAPILDAPTDKEPLLLYIVATSQAVNTVLVVERPEKGKIQAVQRPVYYLSEVLSTSKQNYPHHQKMCYGVYLTAKKLKQYFQEHVITVVSTAPIGEIIWCRDASGRVAKWAIQLAGHTILYEPRTTIKSQALDDFLIDWTETQYPPSPPDSMHWRMHFDGSKMRLGLGVCIILSSPKGDRLRYALQIHFAASNNVAEYEALVHDLRLSKELGIRCILCYVDSDLVVQQCSSEWDVRNSNMPSYHFLIQKLPGSFNGCEFLHVPRAEKRQPTRSPRSPRHIKPSHPASPSSTCASRPSSRCRTPSPSTSQKTRSSPSPTRGPLNPARGLLKPPRGLLNPARGLISSSRPPSPRTRPSPSPTRGLLNPAQEPPTRNPPRCPSSPPSRPRLGPCRYQNGWRTGFSTWTRPRPGKFSTGRPPTASSTTSSS